MELRSHCRLPLAALALIGLVLPLVRGAALAGRELQDAAAIPSPEALVPQVAAAERLREECFVLEDLDAAAPEVPGQAPSPRGAVGLVRCTRLVLDDGWQLEWDVRFPEQKTRVLHIERWTPAGTTLVWRELRPQSGRTLIAQWAADGQALVVREWGGRQKLEVEVSALGGGILPLNLLELLRVGGVEDGPLHVFDPLSRTFESLRLVETPEEGSVRRVDLVRADGTLAGAWWLDGEGLVAFQWQGGGLRARRIETGEYGERLEAPPPAEPEVARR